MKRQIQHCPFRRYLKTKNEMSDTQEQTLYRTFRFPDIIFGVSAYFAYFLKFLLVDKLYLSSVNDYKFLGSKV